MTRWAKLIECRFDWAGKERKAIINNISVSGARIVEVAERPPVDSVLSLTLLHGEGEITLQAKVVHSRGISLGVIFTESKGALMKKLGPVLRGAAGR